MLWVGVIGNVCTRPGVNSMDTGPFGAAFGADFWAAFQVIFAHLNQEQNYRSETRPKKQLEMSKTGSSYIYPFQTTSRDDTGAVFQSEKILLNCHPRRDGCPLAYCTFITPELRMYARFLLRLSSGPSFPPSLLPLDMIHMQRWPRAI